MVVRPSVSFGEQPSERISTLNSGSVGFVLQIACHAQILDESEGITVWISKPKKSVLEKYCKCNESLDDRDGG